MLVVGGRLLRAPRAIAALRAPRPREGTSKWSRGHDDNLELWVCRNSLAIRFGVRANARCVFFFALKAIAAGG